MSDVTTTEEDYGPPPGMGASYTESYEYYAQIEQNEGHGEKAPAETEAKVSKRGKAESGE